MSVIIPAIDLRGGRCVRLVQGRADAETVYSDDPVAVARAFAAAGAQRLHVVDLDGAFDGLPRNLDVVTDIVRAIDIPVQLGGGIRDMAAIEEVLGRGVQWVILGTAAVEQPELVEAACRQFPGRILVGIDARDGQAAVRGWVEGSGRDAVELALEMGRRGVREIIFTDIARDGTLQGPNVEALQRMTGTGLNIIASGGVSDIDDVKTLCRIDGISGIIIGKAIYTGAIRLEEALAAVDEPDAGGTKGTGVRGRKHNGKRVIACLDVRDGRVVKGVQFAGPKDVGDPVELAASYARQGADEIMLLDIRATEKGRTATVDLVRRVKQVVSVPLTVGGGLRTVADMTLMLDAGADKVSIGSAAVQRPELISEAAEALGTERVVLAIDCRRAASERADGSWEVVIHGGRTSTGLDAVEWARQGARLGAGEIVLNSIDADGTKQGYDNELNRRVVEAVNVPVVASGGAGELAHLRDGFRIGEVDAVLVASILHFREVTVQQIKQYLHDAGVRVVLPTADA